jgi:prolipoprotein diacylglyceryltransferase
VYGGGLMVFHKFGSDSDAWAKAYYVWEQLVFFLMLFAICVTDKNMFLKFYPLIFYSFVRLFVEIATIPKGMQAVNDKETVDMLLWLCTGGVAILFLHPIICEWYDKKEEC